VPLSEKCCSAGVSPAVAGASRSRMQEAQRAFQKRSVAILDEAQEGAGRMPTPQRAGRPRYIRRIGPHSHVAPAPHSVLP